MAPIRIPRAYVWLLGSLACAAIAAPTNHPPAIKHTPVTRAAPGQSITLRATVKDAEGPVKTVRIFYTTSRDAAPFQAPMTSSDGHIFLGAIPASVVSGLTNFAYYIEAADELQATAETPWYTVRFDATAGARAEKSSWKKPALIAGLGAAIAGGALLAAGGGGGGGGDGGTSTVINAGTYTGSSTLYLQFPGEPPSGSTRAISFTVLSGGLISTDTLYPGKHLEARLSDGDFTMTVDLQDPGVTGQIRFTGRLLGSRISGIADGTAASSTGAAGTYSGTFTAVRQ